MRTATFRTTTSSKVVRRYLTGDPRHLQPVLSLSTSTTLASSPSTTTATATALPLSESILKQLDTQNYVVVPDYLPPSLVTALRTDISQLRSSSLFSIARIGQDSTNALDTEIRVAETCFLGRDKPPSTPSVDLRNTLCDTLDGLRSTLSGNPVLDTPTKGAPALDPKLSELLYAYYPRGGFYRRHLDAVPRSASFLRAYSLLIYLNDGWEESDGGMLRLHLDGGKEERPEGVEARYVDVRPEGGTLVLFRSEAVPHEVLDTSEERMAVVGWYNRVLTSGDAEMLAGEGDKMKGLMLVVAAGLVTVGLVGLVV